jgi:transglutaminase-like putative cysteine protease
MHYRTSGPEVLIVPFDYASHYDAVQQLVRPWEVRHLINRNAHPLQVAYSPPVPEQVAQWLRSQFADRQLSYYSDPSGFDCWYSPATTLRRRAGDCEDLTLLTVSLLLAAGVSARVAIGTVPGGGHAWVEGEDAHGGFLIEATSGELHRYQRPSEYTLSWHINPNPALLQAT